MTFAGCVSVHVLLLVDTWCDNKACQFVLFVSFSHMATFTGTGQHTVSLHLVLICPYLTIATMDSVSTLYLTWRMVLSLFFNINIFSTVILQHGRYKVWIIEIDINIFFLEAKS